MSSRTPLELLEIQIPCSANWSRMAGDRKSRFCEHCQKHVHDLSAMPRDEAERLVCQSAGNLCVRLTLDASGHVVTLDYRPPREEARGSWRGKAVISFALALITSAAGAFFFGQGRFPGMTVRIAGALSCPTPTGPVAPGYPTGGTSSTPQANADFEL